MYEKMFYSLVFATLFAMSCGDAMSSNVTRTLLFSHGNSTDIGIMFHHLRLGAGDQGSSTLQNSMEHGRTPLALVFNWSNLETANFEYPQFRTVKTI